MLGDLFFRYGFNEDYNRLVYVENKNGKSNKSPHKIVLIKGKSPDDSSNTCFDYGNSCIMELHGRDLFNPSTITHGNFY
jgi:hypothetical protein